jgi:hypothetical protein
MGKSTKMGPGGNMITNNNNTNIFNMYQSGSGVGASNIVNHRIKNRLAGVYVYRQCDTITTINLSDINLDNNVSISLCQSLTIQFGDTLVIPATKVFNNYGTIIINGSITNNGVINNYGTITINSSSSISNTSTSGSLISVINNYGNIYITNANGRINNYTGSIFNNQSSGIITNFGRIFQGQDNTYGVATFNNSGILKNTGIAVSITIENYFVFINTNTGIIFNNDSGFGMNGSGSLINNNIIYNYNGSYINIQGGCTFENYGTLYNGGASCGGVHPSYNSTPSPLGTVIVGCPP